MFYVVDQWDKCVRAFEEREDAEQFNEKCNRGFSTPKTRVVEKVEE